MTPEEAAAQRDKVLEQLTAKLADDGKLVEAGWVSMLRACVPPDAPEVQVREMRMAFMAGAEHLFSSIMVVLEAGEEPTEADLKRIALIDAELRAFRAELQRWVGIPANEGD